MTRSCVLIRRLKHCCGNTKRWHTCVYVLLSFEQKGNRVGVAFYECIEGYGKVKDNIKEST